MGKHYRSGMYGGKFFPFHTGHLMCINHAAAMCDKLYVILFVNGEYERQVNRDNIDFDIDEYLTIGRRYNLLAYTAMKFDNVVPLMIDVAKCTNPDGTEDWDAETPKVIDCCGRFDAVFSSEPSYDEYFKRAYPWADHVLIDPPREIVPISATMIRNMNVNEAKEWIINE